MLSDKQEARMQVKFVWAIKVSGFEDQINNALKTLPPNAEVVDIKLSTALAGKPEIRGGELSYDASYGALILWRVRNA